MIFSRFFYLVNIRVKIVALVLCLCCANLFGANLPDTLFEVLDVTMSSKEIYDAEKERRIISLKEIATTKNLSETEIYYSNKRLIREYSDYSFDSTMVYLQKNQQIAQKLDNTIFEYEVDLGLISLLAASGRYKEAVDILEKIDRTRLSENLVVEYFSICKKVYEQVAYYAVIPENKQVYDGIYQNAVDSLMRYLSPESDQYLSIIEKQYRDAREIAKAKEINSIRLAKTKVNTQAYSLVTFERALLAELEGDLQEAAEWLILSAISDIKNAVKDNASLAKLADLLYQDNQVDKAYSYIKFSFEDAAFYNSRLRFVAISNVLPVITEAYQLKTNEQTTHLRNRLVIISIMALLLLATLLILYRQIKNLARARNELTRVNNELIVVNDNLKATNEELRELYSDLSEANKVKEHFIGNFLAICSDYIDKMDTYRDLINKYITSHKTKELYEITKSRKMIDKEIKSFYENFDNTFLEIYPDFVRDFNLLLKEDGRIELRNGKMNTELRIFAFIRLGIKESSNIAKLLRYSVNTVYNYRVKVKNSAEVPRDDFEDMIMKIGSFAKNRIV